MALSENLRGMGLMTLAMAGFALTDAIVKELAQIYGQGLILLVSGAGGMLVFAVALPLLGQRLITRDLRSPAVLLRIGAEAVGTSLVIYSLSLVPLSVFTAIMQSMPLLVTLGAALVLGETVGWRRWAAILVGLLGVLVILRPGLDGFSASALLVFLAAMFLSSRDLLSRIVPRTASAAQLGLWGFTGLVPIGLAMTLAGPPPPVPTPLAAVGFGTISVLVGLSILFLTQSMRMGDVSVIAPFRYTRLVFGLLLAILWFGERPDLTTWIGAAIVAASGLYTFYRETRRRKSAAN